ncbi:MAG: hypothetical protein EXR99_10825 [Gemmataceae bacterium]|nr:hypothetical protein [Gemmataceae bacterium]
MQSKVQAQAVAPRPVIRAQAPEEKPASAAIAMPLPEQFGIQKHAAVAKVEAREIDWALVHRKLQGAGSVCFQTEKVAQGYRIVCMVPGKTSGPLQRFEATAADQGQAVDIIMAHLDQLQQTR